MKINNLGEAEKILAAYVPAVKDMLGKDVTVERMWPLLQAIGNPHEKLKVVHIAGTSGKTSTCYFIAALLGQTGAKIGLTVSPHVDSVTERVQINLQPLPGEKFCEYLGEFLELIKDVEPQPTYFELMIAFVYWVFLKEQVDYAVIETGLGGLHDATNVVQRPDKICVLTDIGFDHMHVLGHTLPEIAAQKAGIMHVGNQAFTYKQGKEVMKVFEERASSVGAQLHSVTEVSETADSKLPSFQVHNWGLAKQVFDFAAERDGLPPLAESQLNQAQEVLIPGRMEEIIIGDKILLMDGAHNEQKTTALVDSFIIRYPGKKAAVLLALKTGKEHPGVLDTLMPITEQFIFTTFNTSQELPAVAIPPQELAAYCYSKNFDKWQIIADNQEAYHALLKLSEELLLVTGSFYLLGQIRRYTYITNS